MAEVSSRLKGALFPVQRRLGDQVEIGFANRGHSRGVIMAFAQGAAAGRKRNQSLRRSCYWVPAFQSSARMNCATSGIVSSLMTAAPGRSTRSTTPQTSVGQRCGTRCRSGCYPGHQGGRSSPSVRRSRGDVSAGGPRATAGAGAMIFRARCGMRPGHAAAGRRWRTDGAFARGLAALRRATVADEMAGWERSSGVSA